MISHKHSAWNPGLDTDVPPSCKGLETIYRPENVTTSIADVDEISAMTGLSHEELVIFKPERLVVHELLVRITADIFVAEGEDERDLGKNFRRIAINILTGSLQAHMAEIKQVYSDLHNRVFELVHKELGETLFKSAKAPPATKGRLRFMPWKKPAGQTRPAESIQERQHQALLAYKEKGLATHDALSNAAYKSLYRVLGSIAATRGYIGPDRDLLADLICNHVCNNFGSRVIGKKIAPYIDEAIMQHGYSRVPNANRPILISLKGASAAGKSSLRPMLRQMIKDLGIQAGKYATISPDIWRRLLLDYDSLNEAYRYAGRLTSNEVSIIDGKLDHYIRDKAHRDGSIPHLLVDRFRFDSFSSEKIWKILHGTYVKYVDTMYMYFIITPPEATVERGWERGLKTGRYKAVEDFLDHSIEANAGMPKLLFKWIAYDKPVFRYKFLENSVPRGTYPTTVAYGTQQEMNIVSVSALIDIERYQKININAKTPQQVYPDDAALSVENNIGFLEQCLKTITTVNFVDQVTDTIYVRVQHGVFAILDHQIFIDKLENSETAQIFAEIRSIC